MTRRERRTTERRMKKKTLGSRRMERGTGGARGMRENEERVVGQTTGEFLASFGGKVQRLGSDCMTLRSVSYYLVIWAIPKD